MSVGILGKLFGSPTRVKLLRLFLFNAGVAFDPEAAARRIKSPVREVTREFALLFKAGFLKRRTVYREVPKKIRKKKVMKRTRFPGASLQAGFPFTTVLQRLLLHSALSEKELETRIRKSGRLKLIVLAGLFVGEWESRLDLLIVGDKIKMRRLDRILRSIEAELGRELRYVVFSTADFTYRRGINDRLIRDVFDYPHRIIFDRIGIN